MRRTMTVLLSGVCMLAFAAPAAAHCTCQKDKVSDGWCHDCNVAYVTGVKMNKKLFDALKGKPVDVEAVKCEECKKAIAEDDVCKPCKKGFVKNQAYTSWAAYRLAQGEVKDPARNTCPVCQKAAEESGWCDSCNLGMVGPRAFTDKEKFEKAAEARAVLVKAAASKCERCALALVADGKCEACKVEYKKGKKVATAEGEQP